MKKITYNPEYEHAYTDFICIGDRVTLTYDYPIPHYAGESGVVVALYNDHQTIAIRMHDNNLLWPVPDYIESPDSFNQAYADAIRDYLMTYWESALESFPHDLTSTGHTESSDFDDQDSQEEFRYSEQFTFTVGTLGSDSLEAGGRIEISFDPSHDTKPTLSAWFGVSRNGQWHDKESRVLGENEALQTWFDNGSWDDLVVELM